MSRTTPRVLIVTPTYTHPPDQGNSARINAFGRQLKQRGIEVDVLYFVLDDFRGDGLEQMRREWSQIDLLEAIPHKQQSCATHWALDDWCPDILIRRVRILTEQRKYNAVIVNYVWLSGVLEGVRHSLRILDTHDVFGDRAQIALEAGMEPSWYFTSAAEECRGLDRADVVIAIQDQERLHFASQTSRPVITAGHIVDAPPPLSRQDSERIAFGYFASANPWNIASLRSLDQSLHKLDASPVWAIAGSICARMGLTLCNPIRIGRVNQPVDFYDMVDCVINPMTAGTGLKIKTIEALAHGRPLIGTTQAYLGLNVLHDAQRLTSTDEVADAMREYSQSVTFRHTLQEASQAVFNDYMQRTRQQYDHLAHLISTH